MSARAISPKTVAKAARLAIAPRVDGTFDVAGDTATYRVRKNGARLVCECQAARSGSRCSHVLAVQFQLSSPARS